MITIISLLFKHKYDFTHTAPSGPPLGFAGSARSSSEIITQWQPPLEEHRNGQILGYVIRYRLYGYNDSPWTMQNITNEVCTIQLFLL